MKRLWFSFAVTGSLWAATVNPKPADPTPGAPLVVTMGQRTPAKVRVACNEATLIRLPEGERVMNVYGGDKGEGGVWSVDAGKVPTRFLAVKPKQTGIHTTLHLISDTGQEISLFLQEVTGTDTQFDAEVDANAAGGGSEATFSQVKWVPAEEVTACKKTSDAMKVDVAEEAKKAQERAAAAIADSCLSGCFSRPLPVV